MSVNKARPHVLILPEDDANRQIANGFHLQIEWKRQRQMQVLPVAGGWVEVLELFRSVHVRGMETWPNRFMVLLIDFDGNVDTRLSRAKTGIPVHLLRRVFVLGALTEPENLKSEMGPYETIGRALAQDCGDRTTATWRHRLLLHNEAELARLQESVQPILFGAT
jgi:hypothetical protein